MAKNDKVTGWIILVAVVVVGYFLIAGNPFATTPNGTIPIEDGALCNKDFTASVDLMSRNAFERGQTVNTADTIEYSIWQLTDNGMQIPRGSAAEGDSLEIGYNEEYLVVLRTNASLGDGDIRYETRTYAVDTACNRPAAQIFMVESLPSGLDSLFTNSRLVGANTALNRFESPADSRINVQATFDGESKTATKVMIVFDADRDVITGVAANLDRADVPFAHSPASGERSYAFELGEFKGFQSKDFNLELELHRNAPVGEYNLSYTIYQYQVGYEHTTTGDWISGEAVENNDEDVLLPTFSGTVFIDVTA